MLTTAELSAFQYFFFVKINFKLEKKKKNSYFKVKNQYFNPTNPNFCFFRKETQHF